jgi:hypothetical protein
MNVCRARGDSYKRKVTSAPRLENAIGMREYSARFHGCTCTLRIDLHGATAHWSPTPAELPWRDQHQSLAAYRKWRDECLRAFGRQHSRVARVVCDEAEFAFLRCRMGSSDVEIKLEWRRRGA